MALTTVYKKTHPWNIKVYVSMGTGTDYTTGGTTAGSYTQLGDLKMAKFGGIEWNESDTTHLQSTNAIRESMAGWGKQKPAGFSMYFIDTNLDEFLNQNTSTGYGVGRQTASWAFAFPNPTQPTSITGTYFHTAWMKDINMSDADANSDDPLSLEVEIQPSGKSSFVTS